MGKINIDLGALFGALTKTPTADPNPLYGASAEQAYTDPVTGNTSSVPAYTDAQGNEIPGSLAGKDTTHPFLTPSKWQQLVHPEQSQAINAMNNQSLMHSTLPSIDNSAALRVREGNVKLLDPALQPNTSPLSAAASGYGSLDTSPTYINQQNTALLDAQHGLPGVKAATDLNVGQYDLGASKGAVDRQQMEQSVISGDLVNRWNTTYGLTPQQITLAERQVKAELGFQGSVEQIREQALKNQFEEQSHLVPAQTRLAETQTSNAQNVASEQGNMWPYQKTALDNRMVADAATSHYIPLMDRFANTIDSNNEVHPFTKNPLGASPFAVQMQSLGDLTGAGGGQTIKDSSGKTYRIPAAPPSNIDPLTGGSIAPSGAPTIKSTNGPSVTPDTSGSMDPLVSDPNSPFNTLPMSKGAKDSLIASEAVRIQRQLDDPDLQQRAQMYPSSEYAKQYAALKQRLDELNAQIAPTAQLTSPIHGYVPSGQFTFPKGLR